MSAYTDGLLARSRTDDLHAEAARVARARQAAKGRPAGPGAVSRVLSLLRVAPHVGERSSRPLIVRKVG